MQQWVQQLEAVRETGRRLLLAQRLLRWLALFLATALAIATLDYLLRLPGWLRLCAGVALSLALIWRLASWIADASLFKPPLGTLALRAEKLFPQLAGWLASGVEFASQPQKFSAPKTTAGLADASVRELESRMAGVDLRRLVEPRPTLRQAAFALAAAAAVAAVVLASPQSAVLAVKRWLLPLGDTQWPHRTELSSLVTHEVWPVDAPLRLQAKVSRGYSPGMRAWVHYRLHYSDGGSDAWRDLLMNDQSAAAAAAGTHAGDPERGTFERLVELNLGLDDPARARSSATPSRIEFTFEAGDALTAPQEVALTQRPALRELRLLITPPDYAAGIVSAREVAMDRQSGAFVSESALAGSKLKWTLVLNKPIPPALALPHLLMPGWNRDWTRSAVTLDDSRLAGADGQPTLTLSFRLDAMLESPLKLTDEHGLSSLSDRVYRIEATGDQPPAATITQPAIDEGVLATAVIPVEAMGTDDVGLESLTLVALPVKSGSAPTTTRPAEKSLTNTTGRNPRLAASANVDIASFGVQPGDEVHVAAVAQDVFDLDGKRHEPVRSLPRRLRVIDQAAMAAQIRADLDAIRQQALRLQAQQEQLTAAPLPAAAAGQPDLSRAIESQSSLLKAVQDRMTRNRLDDPAMSKLVQQARELSSQATSAARASQPALEKADKSRKDNPEESRRQEEKARAEQKSAAETLANLASLLDSGKDTAGIQSALSSLIGQQRKLAAESRALQPKTMGLSPSQLSPEDKGKIDDMAQRQESLNRRAEELVRKMQTLADQQARAANTPAQQAAAKALSDAAKTAQEQDLSRQMSGAASQTQQNKLGEAGKSQDSAASTMEKMAQQLANQEQIQQEVLKRKIMALADAVRKLVEQQKAQLDALDAAKEDAKLPGLEPGLSQLRKNTLVVAEDAKAVKQAAQAAQLIVKAGGHQADALAALRSASRAPASAGEKQSLAALESALEALNRTAQRDEDEKKSEEKRQLREAYEKLAARQTELRQATAPLARLQSPTRRERADIVDLGHRQADIQVDAAALGQKVRETFLFAHMHTRIDKTAASVAMRLRDAAADDAVLADEDNLASMFRALAQALRDAEKNDAFQQEQQQQSGDGSGSGGSGPLVPPIAELKLLRELQSVIHDQTRALAQQKPTPQTESRLRRETQELAGQQNELSRLGVELINKMQRRAPMEAPPQQHE